MKLGHRSFLITFFVFIALQTGCVSMKQHMAVVQRVHSLEQKILELQRQMASKNRKIAALEDRLRQHEKEVASLSNLIERRWARYERDMLYLAENRSSMRRAIFAAELDFRRAMRLVQKRMNYLSARSRYSRKVQTRMSRVLRGHRQAIEYLKHYQNKLVNRYNALVS